MIQPVRFTMLRDKNLIPLSHQHQHALALCVRIERASPIAEGDLDVWQTEIAQLCQAEIAIHFAAEEQVIFPAARGFGELAPLVEELLADHVALRQSFARAEVQQMSAADLLEFSRRLAAHIRKEERQLFECMQQLISQEGLDRLGTQLTQALQRGEHICVVPSAATRLRPAKTMGEDSQ
jgi:hemerythrin-like domain-containing protein